MADTVGEVAKLAHVSVRTLHHYDEVGLVQPSARSDAGYRLYTPADLERLQQVLFYKELGFGLEEIRHLMADPAFDRRAALIIQRDLIAKQALRLQAMLGLIDKTLMSLEGGITMSKEEMFEVFGDFDPVRYGAVCLRRHRSQPCAHAGVIATITDDVARCSQQLLVMGQVPG